MRLIRLKLKPDVSEYLQIVGKRTAISDQDFLADAYSIIRVCGKLPDDDRLKHLVNAYSIAHGISSLLVGLVLRKRRMILNQFCSLSDFQLWVSVPRTGTESMQFLERILTNFRVLANKSRSAKCSACQYLSACAFGQKFGSVVLDIGKVVDPKYKSMVHTDCPSLPDLDAVNSLAEAFNLYKTMTSAVGGQEMAAATNGMVDMSGLVDAEEEATEKQENVRSDGSSANIQEDDELTDDPDEGVVNADPLSTSRSDGLGFYATNHTLASIQLNSDFIKELTQQQLMLFDMAKLLGDLLAGKDKKELKATPDVTRARKTVNMESISDLPKLLPAEQALPEELFDAKMAKKSLQKVQSVKPQEKIPLFYLLIDSSASMKGWVASSGAFGACSRSSLAASFALAAIRKAQRDKGIVYLRFFESNPSRLTKGVSVDQLEDLAKSITYCTWNGSGTNIPAALRAAFADIQSAKDSLSKAEILMITDCCDPIPPHISATLRQSMGDTPLNTLDVMAPGLGPEQEFAATAVASLKELSDNFYQIDPSQSLVDAVKLVGGKKRRTV